MPLIVNDETVDDAVLSQEAVALRQRFQELPDEQREQYGLNAGALEKTAIEWARENVIEQTLLRQKALADPNPLDDKVVDKATTSSSSGRADQASSPSRDAIRSGCERTPRSSCGRSA